MWRTRWAFALATLAIGISALPLLAQSPQAQAPAITDASVTNPAQAATNAPQSGSISGSVVDKDGAMVANATIVVTSGSFRSQSATAGDGSFSLKDIPVGTFELSVSAPGFATQTKSGVIRPGEDDALPPVQLVVATEIDVNVTQTREEIAEEQIHVEEQQRILGVVPNYYVSYDPEAQPLNPRQKFQLGWKFTLNPVMFGIAGISAGIEQATNSFKGYGQGAQGYAKRFGASYADFASGTFLGNVVFPVLLKQDPRYFYKGTGSRKSRLLYALANSVICKGDNGHWQPNYSSVMGSLAAGGISNLYYPASSRNGVGLTFVNTLLGVGGSAMGAVVEEFFSKRLTPHGTRSGSAAGALSPQ